jgi:hypothetical protein
MDLLSSNIMQIMSCLNQVRGLAVLFVLLLPALPGCGPIGPFPGGHLSGELGPRHVEDWSFAADEERAQLETRPENPYSVNTWFVALGPSLYLVTSPIAGPTDPAERGWVANVLKDPRVRIRLGDQIYERVANRLKDASESAKALEALEAKYDIDTTEQDPEREIWVFRLDSRID